MRNPRPPPEYAYAIKPRQGRRQDFDAREGRKIVLAPHPKLTNWCCAKGSGVAIF